MELLEDGELGEGEPGGDGVPEQQAAPRHHPPVPDGPGAQLGRCLSVLQSE